jgi:Disordered region of unknown function (DUF5315)
MAQAKPGDLPTSMAASAQSSIGEKLNTSPGTSPGHSPRTSIDRASLLGQLSSAPLADIPLPHPGKADGSKTRPQPSLREALGRVRASANATGSTPPPTTSPFSPPSAISPTGPSGLAGKGGNASAPFSSLSRAGAAPLDNRPSRDKAPTTLERTDALWADMQRTLQEVELSASRGTHFFGRGHPMALQELRDAQIKLAQAWAREGEEEGGGEETPKEKIGAKEGAKERKKDGEKDSDSEKSPGASISSEDGDETEADMAAARQRREASDRYFERVSRHVEQVTRRLEDVAVAMGKVEEESREGWSEEDEDEGLESGSMTTRDESEKEKEKEKEKGKAKTREGPTE